MACEHVMLNCGKCTTERDQLREQLASASAEIERLRACHSEEVRRRLADDLVHAEFNLDRMTTARNRLAAIATTLAELQRDTGAVEEIEELRKVGNE